MLWFTYSLPLNVGEIDDFEEVQGEVRGGEEEGVEFGKVGDLTEVVVVQGFKVVPQGVLDGVLETLWIILAQPLCE